MRTLQRQCIASLNKIQQEIIIKKSSSSVNLID